MADDGLERLRQEFSDAQRQFQSLTPLVHESLLAVLELDDAVNGMWFLLGGRGQRSDKSEYAVQKFIQLCSRAGDALLEFAEGHMLPCLDGSQPEHEGLRAILLDGASYRRWLRYLNWQRPGDFAVVTEESIHSLPSWLPPHVISQLIAFPSSNLSLGRLTGIIVSPVSRAGGSRDIFSVAREPLLSCDLLFEHLLTGLRGIRYAKSSEAGGPPDGSESGSWSHPADPLILTIVSESTLPLTQAQIVGQTVAKRGRVSEKTVRERVKFLRTEGLIRPPKGKKQRNVTTAKGQDLLSRLENRP